jgi:hypothetical protein
MAFAKGVANGLLGQHSIDYTYTAECQGADNNDITTVIVWAQKYLLLYGSCVSQITASVTTFFAFMPPGPHTPAFLVTEAAFVVITQASYITASDPPDFNYTEVAMPEIPEISELAQIEDPNLRQAAEKAIELAATSLALRTSMERYEGAKIDGQPEYMALQIEAVKSYSERVAELTDWLSDFWGPISDGLPIPTPEQIQQAREKLLHDGLPELEVSILSAFGYSPEQMTEIAQSVASLPDEYFTSPENIKYAMDAVADAAAVSHRYILGPEPVDEIVDISVEHIGYDREARRFGVDITVTNVSTTTIWTPVWLVIESTSDPLVLLATSDGRTPEDKDYVDLSDLLLNDGKLDPLESVTKRIYFYDPEGVRFTFKPSVRGVIVEQPAPGPLEQLSGLATHWLGSELSLDVVPAGGDGIINFRDFALIAEDWLNKE